MDAVLYLNERKRMTEGCNTDCNKCVFSIKNNGKGLSCVFYALEYPEETVKIVEKWSKEHPFFTNRMKYMEVFGVYPQNSCPPPIKGKPYCSGRCTECIKWWDEEYKGPYSERMEGKK